jgi:hypothetical protein
MGIIDGVPTVRLPLPHDSSPYLRSIDRRDPTVSGGQNGGAPWLEDVYAMMLTPPAIPGVPENPTDVILPRLGHGKVPRCAHLYRGPDLPTLVQLGLKAEDEVAGLLSIEVPSPVLEFITSDKSGPGLDERADTVATSLRGTRGPCS